MIQFLKNPLVPWVLVLLAGVGIGILFKSNKNRDLLLDKVITERDEAKQNLKEKDAKIFALQDSIADKDSTLVRVTKSIDKLIEEDNQISNRYEGVYLNPDSADWNKLDSLSSIILHR